MSNEFGGMLSGMLADANGELASIDGELMDGDEGHEPSFNSENPPRMEIIEQPSAYRQAVQDGEATDELADYLKIRDFYHTLLEKTQTAIEGSLNVALDSQQSRPFEVTKQLMDVGRETGKAIMELHKNFKSSKKIGKELGEDDKGSTGQGGATGDTITTSPASLAQFMQNANKESNEEEQAVDQSAPE